jgi:hypothetical protein
MARNTDRRKQVVLYGTEAAVGFLLKRLIDRTQKHRAS